MGRRFLLLLGALWLVVAAGLYAAFVVLPPVQTLGDSYRIFYVEFPSALTMYVAFTVTLAAGLLFLRRREPRWDRIAYASAKLGLLFTTLTLVTGSLWAGVSWGSYWNWDPVETTTLVLWFLFVGYFLLRRFVEDREAAARVAAVFSIFAYAGVPMTYISTRVGFSLHPTSGTIGLEPAMRLAAWVMLAGFVGVYALLLRTDVSLSAMERAAEEAAWTSS